MLVLSIRLLCLHMATALSTKPRPQAYVAITIGDLDAIEEDRSAYELGRRFLRDVGPRVGMRLLSCTYMTGSCATISCGPLSSESNAQKSPC